MSTFTIDSENNIAAHAVPPADTDGLALFASEKELAKLMGEWPATRMIETWNSFAGVAPFDDLKPVKKFTNRKAAVGRIWQAVQRLVTKEPEEAAAPKKATKPPAKAKRATKAPAGEGNNKKAQVIALMKRAKGVTLEEIMEITGWQKHTVRGFVSIMGSKGGETIESTKSEKGERTYRIAT